MQSWLIELLLHLIFYLTIFIGSAYYAGEYREPNWSKKDWRACGPYLFCSYRAAIPSHYSSSPHHLLVVAWVHVI